MKKKKIPNELIHRHTAYGYIRFIFIGKKNWNVRIETEAGRDRETDRDRQRERGTETGAER